MRIAKYIRQLGIETAIYGLAGTIGRFIGIFLVPLYTRTFTPADYGIIALATTITSLLRTFSVLGLDSASARWYYDDYKDNQENRRQVISSWLWAQIAISLFIFGIVFIFSSPLSSILLDSSKYSLILILAVLDVPLVAFSKVLGNWLRYQRRAWAAVSFTITDTLVTIGLTVLFVLVLRKGIVGVFLAQVLASTIMASISIYILRSWISPRHISMGLLKSMLLYGLPLVPAAVAAWATASSDRYILKIYWDTTEIGLYAIAITIASAIALVTNAFATALGPFTMSIMEKPEARQVYAKILSVYSLVGCWAGTMFVLFTPFILRILTTPDYYSAASSVPFLVFSQLIIGTRSLASVGSSIAKKSVPVAVSIGLASVVSVGLNFLLVPFLGKDGAAITNLVAYLLATIYMFHAAQKAYPIPYRFRDAWICFAISGLLIFANQYFLPQWDLASTLMRILLGSVFVPLAFFLGIVRLEHIKALVTMLQKGFTHNGSKA